MTLVGQIYCININNMRVCLIMTNNRNHGKFETEDNCELYNMREECI